MWIDILIDLIGEILFTGGEHALKSSRTPKPLRYLIIVLVTLFFIGLIGFIVMAGIGLIKDSSVIGGIALLALAVFLVVFAIMLVVKAHKAIKKKEDFE